MTAASMAASMAAPSRSPRGPRRRAARARVAEPPPGVCRPRDGPVGQVLQAVSVPGLAAARYGPHGFAAQRAERGRPRAPSIVVRDCAKPPGGADAVPSGA